MTTADSCVRIEELTWVEFRDRAPQTSFWLITAGSVEQHGPHLPLGADTMVADRLAEVVARRNRAVILGTVAPGVLHAFRGWPGGQRVAADTVRDQVSGLARPAVEHSNRILIINGHDENHEPLMLAARELEETHGTDVLVVEWAQLVGDVIAATVSSSSETHAGEGLTSVFLHWFPDRVRTEAVEPGMSVDGELTRDDLHTVTRAHRIVTYRPEDVPNGVLGDPLPADRGKGRTIVDALVDRCGDLVAERGWT